MKEFRPGTKLIVFWSCILTLLKVCNICYQPAVISKIFRKGTKVIVDVICKFNHKFSWHSQPNENGRAAGNIAIVASTVISGGTFERLKEIFQTALIPLFSHTTFYKIQKRLVLPAIHRVFITQRQLLFDDARERERRH